MNFEIQRNFRKEGEVKRRIIQSKKEKKESTKEEGSFANHFYDSYESRLKRKVTDEMMSEATQGKTMSWMKSRQLGRRLEPAIIVKVDEILENENHCRHVLWDEEVEVIQEIHSVEGWNLLKDYRYNWERRDLERERMEIKMKVKEILSEIVSSIV